MMQPRTKKGPSWANETHSQPQPNATFSIGDVHASRVGLIETAEVDGQAEGNPDGGGNEGGISDLDWMKRRMKQNIDATEKIFEQSDDETDSGGAEKEDIREVGTRPSRTLRLVHGLRPFFDARLAYASARTAEGPNERNDPADITIVPPEPRVLVYGRRSIGTVSAFWRGITGENFISYILVSLVFVSLDRSRHSMASLKLAKMINIYRDIRLCRRMLILRENR